jgi:hypothetical protein
MDDLSDGCIEGDRGTDERRRSQPFFPVLWVTGLVLNGQHDDPVSLNQIEDCVGKAPHDGATDITITNLVLRWVSTTRGFTPGGEYVP